MINLGSVLTDDTIRIPFNTYDGSGASVTVTDLAASDVHIHKDGSLTQRASSNGITVSIDYDGVTGNHYIVIDLSDNSDAGFYAADSVYDVRLEGITVDGQTLNVWIGRFRISSRPFVDDLNNFDHNTDTVITTGGGPLANPSLQSISDFTVTQIASNITAINIFIVDQSAKYYFTYRLTGQAAPSAPTSSAEVSGTEWIRFNNPLSLTFGAAVDVYVITDGAGKIRVDS